MSFIDASVINARTVRGGTRSIATAQHSIPNVLVAPSQKVSTSIANTIGGTLNTVNNGVRTVVNTVNTVQNIAANAIRAVDTAQRTYNNITRVLGIGKSSDKLFSSSATGLASGISPSFAGSFTDRSIKGAANTTTLISDPTKTLLSKTRPSSSAYKIDSLDAGSKSVTLSGSLSKFGSGSVKMTGTTESTLLNRFNLDGSNNLGSSIGGKLQSDRLGGLFSSISKIARTTRTVANDISRGTNALMNAVYSVKREYDAVVGVVNEVKDTATALFQISSLNDLKDFSNQVGDLSGALGNFDLSSYYMYNATASLIDESDRLINTYGSGVDATTANALIAAMRKTGCYSGDAHYRSASGMASLYNASMSMAGRYGMTRELGSLLGCSHASTTYGQDAISRSFRESVGSQLPAADLLLRSIKSPTALNTPTVRRDLLTNPNLTAADLGSTNFVFNSLGTSTQEALSVPGASSSRYPVYDLSLISAIQPNFVNAVFQSTTITDVLAGGPMNFQPDGGLLFV